MNLTLITIINAVLDTAIISGLAFVMSRSAKLTPHRPHLTPDAHRRQLRPLRTPSRPRSSRVGARLSSALD